LLTGAALVQRPDLWGAVYSGVPLLDMLRFHLTEGGKYWTKEYGNPDNPEHVSFLRAYSPYHNVKKAVYPPTLFETSLGDDRGVDPMRAMKMAARVSYHNQGDNPILLRVKQGQGHGGAWRVSDSIEQLVDQYSFFKQYLQK